jgi:3-oxoadipate enol-lactonase
MKKISVDDGVLEVADHGAGRPLILLHSLLTDSSAFDRVVPDFARDRRAIRINLPGFGGSSPVGSSIEHIADRVAALLPQLELSADADVLGNGFGGFVAGMLAIRHGERFDRLILANTGAGFSESGKAAFHTMASRVREHGMEGVVDIAMRRLFPESYIEANADVVEERRQTLLRNDPERFAQACLALADLDMREHIGGIRNPALVLVGSLDSATPPAMSQELARLLPGSRYVELEGCGHAPMIQAPTTFLAAVTDFLQRA